MKVVRRKLADGTIKTYRYGPKQPRILPRSLGALVQEYRAAPDFRNLAPATHKTYLRAMGHMEPLYRVAIESIKRRHIVQLRDRFASTPAIANQILAVFSVLMNYAVQMEYRETNPAQRIKVLAGGEFRRWTDIEIAFALEHFPERFRRAITLALYTGQRQSDILSMKWSDYDGEGIAVVQQKTGAKVWIPCHSTLSAGLEAWKADRGATTIIVNALGVPYKVNSFATMFSHEVRKHIELTGLVFHGLRKTAAAKLAEAGCTAHEIAAITGHKTLAMLQHYTREADQRSRARAAVVKLENAARKR